MANWAELLEDVLFLIGKRLTLLEDLIAFGGVCVSWRSVMIELKKNYNIIFPQVPWLMLAEKEDCSNFRGFYSLTKCKIELFMLPEASGKKLFSSQGWLLTVASDHKVNLLHPLSRVQIELPNLTTFTDLEEIATTSMEDLYHNFIQKVALSSNPLTSDYTVMVIHGSIAKLAFYKKGDIAWTTVKTRFSPYSDIIFFEGRFYAIDCNGKIVVCDVNDACPTVGQIVSVMPTGIIHFAKNFYLVESLGKLLVVLRQSCIAHEDGRCEHFEFRVFDLNWVEVQNLGNRALFVGFNSSFSIEASEITRCKANSIYFTDDLFEAYTSVLYDEGPSALYTGGGEDMGIYSLIDGSIQPHFKGTSLNRISPPLWVMPSFKGISLNCISPPL